MDAEVLRFMAHVDQTRSEMRGIVRGLSSNELARLVKICAAGRLADLDEDGRLLVGMLAIVSIFNLKEEDER
jgi:formylmethanofuran dehydrogenase subunit A